ncbi:TPA: helix-turn-helix domain-containing protein [Burkholderia vietnamiensis]|nr:helix-turn-helix domain-containing protein [Burkholderia vietnamiensis]HEP6274485.1 helix-turn-helix domain-containing protein [Burkholderia vietnamiensis]HEP6283984.1 helix-turn-helix domain-containing protein [Burkholderia vietnamiensis]HEP6309450.1 helix-turn-helix domain-containing protein [Burkholderia vietnamiensis]
MPSLDAALKTYEVLTALHALPDQAALTTAEAALFLRLSPKTMERMRLDGSGPPYVQAGAKGARGRNQKCLYLKSSLLAWQQANQISNAMEAAVRKGQAFKTIFDLVADAPFYLDANGRVAGAAEDTSLDVVIERLGSDVWDLLWLPVVEAAGREWADLAAHQNLARELQTILVMAEQKIAAALEASGIGSAIVGRH